LIVHPIDIPSTFIARTVMHNYVEVLSVKNEVSANPNNSAISGRYFNARAFPFAPDPQMGLS
jgi:hypothetical protein